MTDATPPHQKESDAAVTAITTANVHEAFDEAADRYDLMVGLNPGYHGHLRSAAEALAERLPRPSGNNGAALLRLADLGCGSGASTRALLHATQRIGVRATIVGVDASAGMLEQARAKPWPPGVSFEVGLAEELVQEYSVAGSPLAATVWSLVCWSVVVPLSWLTSRRTRLYRYLWRSVLRFDSVQAFSDRLYGAGFVDVEVRTVPGWQRGILHTFRARKPSVPPL